MVIPSRREVWALNQHLSSGPASAPAVGDEEVSEHDAALELLRNALWPNETLAALRAVGLDSQDLAEGLGVDDRTVRRWVGDNSPNRSHQKTIGDLRVLVIHILQRRGIPVDSVAQWLRLPDAQLSFSTPLAAIADGRFSDVVVAADLYMAPRAIGSWQPVVSNDPGPEPDAAPEVSPAADADASAGDGAETGDGHGVGGRQGTQGETGEISAVSP